MKFIAHSDFIEAANAMAKPPVIIFQLPQRSRCLKMGSELIYSSFTLILSQSPWELFYFSKVHTQLILEDKFSIWR